MNNTSCLQNFRCGQQDQTVLRAAGGGQPAAGGRGDDEQREYEEPPRDHAGDTHQPQCFDRSATIKCIYDGCLGLKGLH